MQRSWECINRYFVHVRGNLQTLSISLVTWFFNDADSEAICMACKCHLVLITILTSKMRLLRSGR